MLYVVLGMHKSGTTLVSQILHNSGVNMVEVAKTGVSYDEGNKYERESALALNMEILDVSNYEVRDLPQPKNLTLTPAQREKMRDIIVSATDKYSDWGFKGCGRPIHTHCGGRSYRSNCIIGIYRSPDEIWPRFRWRGLRKRYMNPLWAWQFLSRWMEHNLSLIEYLQSATSPYLLLDYRKLMVTDTEIERLQAFTGFPIKDTRRRELDRTKKPRADLCLEFADWLMRRVRGMSAKDVMRQLAYCVVFQR